MFDSFYFEEEQKSMRTAFLMTALTVLLVLVGDYFGGARGMMMMLIISLAMNLFSYWNSDKLVLAQYNAKQVDEKSAPALYKMVQRLAERGNLPMPKVYIIDSPVPNAFATGRPSKEQATTAPDASFGRPEISISDGFSTSESPFSSISNTPISFVEPKRFFTARRTR